MRGEKVPAVTEVFQFFQTALTQYRPNLWISQRGHNNFMIGKGFLHSSHENTVFPRNSIPHFCVSLSIKPSIKRRLPRQPQKYFAVFDAPQIKYGMLYSISTQIVPTHGFYRQTSYYIPQSYGFYTLPENTIARLHTNLYYKKAPNCNLLFNCI